MALESLSNEEQLRVRFAGAGSSGQYSFTAQVYAHGNIDQTAANKIVTTTIQTSIIFYYLFVKKKRI